MNLSILNYGAGNLKSITNLLELINVEYKIITSKEEIEQSDALILPGVGHFGQLMDYFTQNDLIDPLKTYINSGKPYLGICLGMQILFESSEEAPDRKGLKIFPGQVIKFSQGKVPQIGWNNLNVSPDCSLLTEDYVYFVNSYCIQTDRKDIIAATTNYYIDFVSAVEHNNIFAVQFHPEKSGKVGTEIIKRWLNNVN